MGCNMVLFHPLIKVFHGLHFGQLKILHLLEKGLPDHLYFQTIYNRFSKQNSQAFC